MDINYDLIFKYLVTKKNTFVSKKHILVYSDLFPDKFKDLLQNKFYRYGINQDESFYITLLTLLNKNFITFNKDEETSEIKSFKKSLHDTNKNIIGTTIKDIQLIVDILDINLFIFDFKSEDIKSIFSGSKCNPYKVTLMMANYDEYYEPIIYETDNKKLFSYNDVITKKIYLSNILSYDCLNKPYMLDDNLKNLVNKIDLLSSENNSEQNETLNKSDQQNETLNKLNETLNKLNLDEENSFIKNEYTVESLTKMTKKDLELILIQKNIKININKTLKKDIIDLILQ